MHLCAEYFFKVNMPPPPTLEDLLRFYEKNWLSEGYESAEEEARYKNYGTEILTKFWMIHSASFRLPIATERPFNVDINGVKVRGVIDRVDKMESGGLAIVDYKTNKELFTTDYLNEDLQLTLYQIAAGQMWRMPVEQLTLYHLRSNTACTCTRREPARLEEAKQLVVEVAENIAQGNFPAIEGQFCPCDFPEHCPYHRHKYMKEEPIAPRQGMLPGLEAIEAVDRYASIQSQIKELQFELEEAKQIIIKYCQSEKLNRVFTNEHAITYKIVERTGFSEEQVRAILEPAGLWEKVLSLDQSLVKELLSDENIARDIRNKLNALRCITGAYPQLWVKKRTEEEK
jgi:putative RecB family exonuclease